MATYRELSKHYWRRETGTWMGAGPSSGVSYQVFHNAEGLAWARTEDLETP